MTDSMCNSWITARGEYDWTVDLSHFRSGRNYPGHFDSQITPQNTVDFEDKFRGAIDHAGSYKVVAEVCFWKNYGIPQSRDRLTERLLRYLEVSDNWHKFVDAIRELSSAPSWSKFKTLQKACNQTSGFATPLAFLAFYSPAEYPMVDKHIAFWWAENKGKYEYGDLEIFSQRDDGWIQPAQKSWKAYMCWARFCREYTRLMMKNCSVNWRARDIEMAVWEAQKRGLSLNVLL